MVIVIDTGGTNTRLATADAKKTFDPKHLVKCPTQPIFTDGMNSIASAIQSLGVPVEAIAMGVPGSLNEAGEILRAPNLSDWVGKPLQKTLIDRFACPVLVRNDAEMGAYGEAHFGGLPPVDFAYLAWGTGIGFAQVTYRDGVATISRPNNRDLVHELEAKVGGKNLAGRFGKPAKELTHSEWGAVLTDITTHLPNLVRHYGFTTVVVGGGVATSLCPQLAFGKTLSDLAIKATLTNLGDHSGLYGAFSLLKENQLL